MTILKAVVIACDGLNVTAGEDPLRARRCGALFSGVPSEPRDVVIHRAKHGGWTVTDGGAWHYCPKCSKHGGPA